MSRGKWFTGAALAYWMTAAGTWSGVALRRPAAGAPPPPPPGARATAPVTVDRPAATADARPAATMRAKDVLGSKVSLKGGLAIGTVDDIIFDDDGGIDYLVVQNEGKDVLVPWDAAKFDFSSRAATVDVTQEQWRTIPTYAPTELPVNVYEPAFQTKIYGYYNLKPRRAPHRAARSAVTSEKNNTAKGASRGVFGRPATPRHISGHSSSSAATLALLTICCCTLPGTWS